MYFILAPTFLVCWGSTKIQITSVPQITRVRYYHSSLSVSPLLRRFIFKVYAR